jgi:hypothetical protein
LGNWGIFRGILEVSFERRFCVKYHKYKLFVMPKSLLTLLLNITLADSRAYTIFRKLQFLGNFRGFSAKKHLGIFSLKAGVFRGFSSSMGWQP